MKYFFSSFTKGSSQLPLVNEDNEDMSKISNMKIHVPSTLPKGIRTTNKQTQQRSSHNVSVDCLYIILCIVNLFFVYLLFSNN